MDFVRNAKFDSRPFGTIGKMPPFTLNQFGGNIGGPIVPQRTFFFANYEGIRRRQTRSFTRSVPSETKLGYNQSNRLSLYGGHVAGVVRTHHRAAQPRLRHRHRAPDAVHVPVQLLNRVR